MESIGAYEAKTHLSELLERVAKGERITITKHGVPIAVLVPVEARPRPDVAAVIEEIKRTRQGRSLGGLKIKDLIEEGRKY
jgi:prevent-host-death family protein